jgi:hypothetical protein
MVTKKYITIGAQIGFRDDSFSLPFGSYPLFAYFESMPSPLSNILSLRLDNLIN